MTTLNISMTSALQETLSHPGAYAYAVYFNSASGALQSGTVVVSNGVVVNSGTASAGVTSVGLPGTYVGGKVYFIIQSIDPTSSSGIFSGSPGSAVVAGTITSQSQISWDTATANDFRYDSFCKGTSNGVAVFETKSFIISGTGLFQSWSFNSASSNLTAAGGPNATGANITLGGVPYATSVNWYQLTVASGSVSRTYDYYLDAVAGCPQSLLQRRQPVRVDCTRQSRGAPCLTRAAALAAR